MNATSLSYAQTKQRIVQAHDTLSPRLQEVAHYVLENPHSVAFDTLAVIAQAAGVHASTLVRFASSLDFSGFSELQQIYRQHLLADSPDYGERIRRLKHSLNHEHDHDDSPFQLFSEFTEANLLSLRQLQNSLSVKQLEHAVRVMDRANSIYVCGIRRAFPVAMYFAYAMGHINARCYPIDGIGVMQNEQANWIRQGDLLIAITYKPYAHETQQVIEKALANGAQVMLLTDSELCPNWSRAEVGFALQDAEVRSFRSLNATLCLAQTLCIALGYRRESIPAAASGTKNAPSKRSSPP